LLDVCGDGALTRAVEALGVLSFGDLLNMSVENTSCVQWRRKFLREFSRHTHTLTTGRLFAVDGEKRLSSIWH